MSDRYVFRGVNEAVVVPTSPPSTIGNRFVAGVYAEWFRGEMGLAVVERDTGQVASMQYIPSIDSSFSKRNAIFDSYKHWRFGTIWCSEPGIGNYLIMQWQMDGLPAKGFHMTHLSQRNVIEALAAAIEKKKVLLPNDKGLLDDLRGYQVDLSPDPKYMPRRGSTPARVMALAIAWYGMTHSGWLVDFV